MEYLTGELEDIGDLDKRAERLKKALDQDSAAATQKYVLERLDQNPDLIKLIFLLTACKNGICFS